MIPHPDKEDTGGEDACFTSPLHYGVFDGVGGWANMGVDSGQYSTDLAALTFYHMNKQKENGAIQVDIIEALRYAMQKNIHVGSTTACVVSYSQECGILNGANLGDSRAMVLRRDALGNYFTFIHTQEQLRDFNFPLQLGTNCTDKPDMADKFSFVPIAGDVCLLMTDGIMDNMYEQEILDCVQQNLFTNDQEEVDRCAENLAETAFRFSLDEFRKSPWEDAARKAGKLNRQWTANKGLFEEFQHQKLVSAFTGGKMDDITVIVARFVENKI